MIGEARAYGEMFESPSAFQHFWSLSAEEQCIWLLPAVLAAVVVLLPRLRWLAVATVAAVLLFIPALIEQSPDATYYGTPNRVGEFLAGRALALWLAHRTPRPDTTWVRPVRAFGAVSLATLLVAMLSVERGTPWLYRGGLALVVLPVIGVLLAITTHGGLASRALSLRPLPVLGRWALSIYVLHWPLYLLLEEGHIGLTGAPLALVEIVAAIALGGVVHRYVERPLLSRPHAAPVPTTPPVLEASAGADRSSGRGRSIEHVLLPAAGGLAVLLIVISLAIPAPSPVYDFAAAEARANQTSTSDAAPNTDAPDSTSEGAAAPPPPGAVSIGVFGGSTGVLLGAALFDWAAGIPDVQAVPAWSRFGCGFVTAGEYLGRDPLGNPERVRPGAVCQGWEERWFDATRQHRVQVALIVTGVWETTDWVPDGYETPSPSTARSSTCSCGLRSSAPSMGSRPREPASSSPRCRTSDPARPARPGLTEGSPTTTTSESRSTTRSCARSPDPVTMSS